MIAAAPDTRLLPLQPWAADLQAKRAAEGGLNDPDGLCMPQGPLQYHVDPQPLKIVQTSTQILILYESNYGLRTITWTDARSHRWRAAAVRTLSVAAGTAIARWSSEQLSKATPAGFAASSQRAFTAGWLDHRGSPYTEAMTLQNVSSAWTMDTEH
jgi:hypothetical protein